MTTIGGEGARTSRRRTGLVFRLLTAMGLVLLPLAVLSYIQTVQTWRVADARARAAILGDTMLAAAPQVEAILRGSGVVAGLAAAIPDLSKETGRCIAALADVQARSNGAYSFITYWRRDGTVDCASDGAAHAFPDNPFLARWMEDPRPLVDVNRSGPVSGTAVVIFAHPVRDRSGMVTGFVTISAPHSGLVEEDTDGADAQDRGEGAPPLALITFDAEGTVLTSSLGLTRARGVLPVNRPLSDLVGAGAQSFIDVTATGRDRAFAVVPLAPGKLFLLGSWPSDRLDDLPVFRGVPAFVFPALMWVASLMVAWIAAEALVIRQVRSLRQSITTFARGRRELRPLRFGRAAAELRDVGDAYEAMTAAILHDEADMENTIHQKEVLLREVHHRVKNNLQLIASILNMQMRSEVVPEAREAMRNVQERVMSLATIHRELYQTSGLTDVRADELFPQIVAQIMRIGATPAASFQVKTTMDAIRLTPDQAVPLALFLTEAMANVVRHARPAPGQTIPVGVTLVYAKGGAAQLSLTNGLPEGSPDGTAMVPGFGTQLMTAFARQLDADLDRSVADGIYSLTLRFPLRPLTEAEERDEARQAGHG